MSKKHTFFNTIFSRFFVVLASESDSKIDVFSNFFQKRRFYEICSFPIGKSLILRSRALKNPPKIDAKTHSKKASKKNLPKIDFGLPFGLPKPPQTLPKSKNLGSRTKPVLRRYGNRPEVVGNQRELRLLDCETGFAYD